MSDVSGVALRVAVNVGVVLAVAATAAAQSGPIRVAMAYRGAWGYGPATGVAVTDGLVLFGAGAMLQVAKSSPPDEMEVIGDLLLRGVIRDIEVIGHHAVVVTTLPGVQVVDVSNAMDPRLVGFLDVAWSGRAVAVGGSGWVAVAAGDDGLRLVSVSDPRSPEALGALTGIGEAREVEVRGSHAFLAAGEHLRVVDVSDKLDPIPVGDLETASRAVDVAFSGEHLALIDTSWPNPWGFPVSGLTMVDVSEPDQPSVLGSVSVFDVWYGVVVVDNWGILVGSTEVYDLSDPGDPRLEEEWWHLGIRNVPAVGGDVAFEANDYVGLRALDVSSLPWLGEISAVPTPWRSNQVAVGGGHAYVLAEDDQMRVLEVASGGKAAEVAALTMPGASLPVAEGSTLYLVEDRENLQTWDIGASPVPDYLGEIHFELSHGIRGYDIDSGRAYVAASYGGMKIVDVSDPSRPTELGSHPELAICVAASGDIAVSIGNAPTGADLLLRVHDVSDPSHPTVLGSVRVDMAGCYGLVMAGPSTAYLADIYQLHAFDLSQPSQPEVVWSTEVPGPHGGKRVWLELMDRLDVLVMVVRHDRIHLFDITEPTAPFLVQALETAWPATDVGVQGSVLAVAEERRLEVFDVSTAGGIRRDTVAR